MHDSVNHLQRLMFEGGETAFDIVPLVLEEVINERLWAEKVDQGGKPFESFEKFVTYKLWWGLESDIDELAAYCRRREDIQRLITAEVDTRPKNGEIGRGRDSFTNSKAKGGSIGGTTKSYLASVLKRDHPEILEEYKAGKYPSMRQAAIAAGIKEAVNSRQFWMPKDPAKAAEAIRCRFGEEFFERLTKASSHQRTEKALGKSI